jgi:hypothetical protein
MFLRIANNASEELFIWMDIFLSTPRFLGAFAKLRKMTISFVMYVCLPVRPSVHLPFHMEQSATTGRILMKFDI